MFYKHLIKFCLNYFRTLLALFCLLFSSTACDLITERLENVGRLPKLNKINVYEPAFNPDYDRIEAIANVDYPGYDTSDYSHHSSRNHNTSNSIWSKNSKTFFKAYEVGDIISILISVQDQAQLNSSTQKNRKSSGSLSIPHLFGLEKSIDNFIADTSKSNSLLDMKSGDASSGAGQISRQERMTSNISATIVRILPSGNLIIKGTQEIRVNYELREITIEGIVRPEDISNDNSVKLSKIAEARVSYGGRGAILDAQQERYGKQILNALSPF